MHVFEPPRNFYPRGVLRFFAVFWAPKAGRFIDQNRMQNTIFWPELYRAVFQKCYKNQCFFNDFAVHRNVVLFNVIVFKKKPKTRKCLNSSGLGRFFNEMHPAGHRSECQLLIWILEWNAKFVFFVFAVDQTSKNKIVENIGFYSKSGPTNSIFDR